MIVVFLVGGLGNQIFQYAAALTLSELRNKDDIVIDIDNYKLDKDRKYELYKFNFPLIHLADEEERKKFRFRCVKAILRWYRNYSLKEKNFSSKFNRYLKSVLNRLGIYISCVNDYEDVPITYNMQKHKNIYLYGYFQYPQYAYNLKNVSLKFTSQGYKLWKENNKEGEHVCVHIRLGDYVQDDFFGICTKNYYYKAFAYIAEKIENPVFHIFSDSMEIVKKEFKFVFPVIYEEEKNTSECLMKMSLCKCFILSNSTFSWWAQRLSQSENKIVVAPAKWYKDKDIAFYLYEKSWKLIDPQEDF